jgi:hypothetical protein
MVKIDELYAKPPSYKFNKEELKFIEKSLKNERHRYKIKYAFYNKKSGKGKYICFIIDSSNGNRKSGIENNWEYFAERSISDIEFREVIENYGTNHRRFQVWYYKSIQSLIEDDLKYHIETPIKFVQECIKRGYNGNFQTLIDFDNY